MPICTIRIREESKRALKQMARATGESLEAVLEKAIFDRQRRLYLEGLNSDYEALSHRRKARQRFGRGIG